MKTFIISYDLRNKNKDYTDLFSEIKKENKWWRYLDNAWIIRTDFNTKELSERLISKMDKELDNLLVVEVDIKYANGWLPKEAWDWIENTKSKID